MALNINVMKEMFILCLVVFINLNLFGNDTLRYNSFITKTLQLEFSPEATEDEAYIVWELNGDWDLFNYSFNQGEQKDKFFTIKASEYKDFVSRYNGVTIILETQKNTKDGQANLKMSVVEVGADLEFDKNLLELNWEVFVIMPPPTPLGLKLLYILAVFIVLFHLIWFVFMKKRLYPKMSGTLVFHDGSIVKLNNYFAFYLYTSSKKPAYAKTGIITEIYCGNKGSFHIPFLENKGDASKYLLIKPVKSRKGYINNLAEINKLELLTDNKKLFHDLEYKFKDPIENITFNFIYNNPKHEM
jgi:hypothetical protein